MSSQLVHFAESTGLFAKKVSMVSGKTMAAKPTELVADYLEVCKSEKSGFACMLDFRKGYGPICYG